MKNSRSFEAVLSIFKAARSYPAMLISAIALALGFAIVTKAVAAETFVLTNGQTVEGSIVQSMLNGIVVKRADIGIERLRHDDIDQVIIPTPRGRISGSWIGWADGVYALRVRDRVVRVRDGEDHRNRAWHAAHRKARAGWNRSHDLGGAGTEQSFRGVDRAHHRDRRR